MTYRRASLLLTLCLLIPYATLAGPPDSSPIVRYTVQGKFENVRDDLVNAITGRGLVIDHNSHVAKMLDRTGKDLGTPKKIYGDDQGQTFSFCSAALSRKTMEADPNNILFCPYTIALYTTLAEPNKVTIVYRRPVRTDDSPASQAALNEVAALLDGIAREAVNLPAK
jgi:uncharacterized protein (DUF302 family)